MDAKILSHEIETNLLLKPVQINIAKGKTEIDHAAKTANWQKSDTKAGEGKHFLEDNKRSSDDD